MRWGATRQRSGALILAALTVVLAMWPGPLGAAWSSASGEAVQLIFQAVRCDSWSSVPANMPDVQIDDTGGQYLQWGPPTASPVPAYDGGSLPPGCTMADGVEIRVSGQENGISLVPGIAQYQPPGHEDGSTTTVVGRTGTSGPGELRLSSGDLTPQQQNALFNLGDGGGLWTSVVLQTLPGSFANLRCHRDTYNADNREVIRPSPVDASAVCVAFAVGGSSAPAVPSPAPGAPPSSEGFAPPQSTAPAPAPPSPTGGAPTDSPIPPTPATTPSPAVNPGAPGGPTGMPVTQAAAPGNQQALGAPVASAAVPAAPAAPAPAAAPAAPATPLAPPAPALPVPPPGPPKLPPTTMSLLVEVGGVTRGSSSSRPGAARSPWIRPVKVQLDCGENLTRNVIVPIGQVPGFRVGSEPVILPAADQSCMVRAEDAGVDLDAHRSDVSLTVDGSVLATGQWLRIRPKSGVDKLVTVNVTFGVTNSDEASPTTSEPTPPSGDQPLSMPVTLSLAGVFAIGLAGAVLRSRRPF